MENLIFILFLFILGSCIGSFLNVVIYRLPLEKSLIHPPSHCPNCQTRLAWYDNIPVLGWILLHGKCRYCHKPISPQYPLIEALTGLLFVFYYVMLFMFHAGPTAALTHMPFQWNLFMGNLTSLPDDWPIYGLYMLLISGLLAASLIDAELFMIPASIPWWIAGVAIIVHAFIDRPALPGSLLISAPVMALSAGATIGVIISIILLQCGIIPLSFPDGDLLEVDREKLHLESQKAQEHGKDLPEIPPQLTRRQVRAEMRKEMLFLMAPLVLAGLSALLATHVPAVSRFWLSASALDWLSGLLGSLLGALVAAFIVWLFRIFGSLVFGREAMGLGDIHLMLGVGAVLGAGASAVAFFLAPFFGIAVAIYMLFTGKRRQLPYGPYLSLATAFVILFYSPIAAYLSPGLQGMIFVLHNLTTR